MDESGVLIKYLAVWFLGLTGITLFVIFGFPFLPFSVVIIGGLFLGVAFAGLIIWVLR